MIERLRIHPARPSRTAIACGVRALRHDKLIIFPTETLYGLGADTSSPKAIRLLYRAKNRPLKKGFILLIARRKELTRLVARVSPAAHILAKNFWPGPLTLIFKKRGSVSKILTGGASTVAVRCTSHPVARSLILALGRPITAPSANISGHAAPRTARAAIKDLRLQAGIQLALDAGRSPRALPSTIVDVSEKIPRILREGAIARTHIFRALRAQ